MRLISLAMLTPLVGCAAHVNAPPEPLPPAQPTAQADRQGANNEMCPHLVPDTRVEWQDQPGGVALSFTTSGDVGELRRRVLAVAEAYNRHRELQSGPASPIGGMQPAPGDMTGGGPAGRQPMPGDSSAGHGHPHAGDTTAQPTMPGDTTSPQRMPGDMTGDMAPQKPGSDMIASGPAAPMRIAAQARAEGLDKGARLVLISTDPARQEELRADTRQLFARMRAGDCPMRGFDVAAR